MKKSDVERLDVLFDKVINDDTTHQELAEFYALLADWDAPTEQNSMNEAILEY